MYVKVIYIQTFTCVKQIIKEKFQNKSSKVCSDSKHLTIDFYIKKVVLSVLIKRNSLAQHSQTTNTLKTLSDGDIYNVIYEKRVNSYMLASLHLNKKNKQIK